MKVSYPLGWHSEPAGEQVKCMFYVKLDQSTEAGAAGLKVSSHTTQHAITLMLRLVLCKNICNGKVFGKLWCVHGLHGLAWYGIVW